MEERSETSREERIPGEVVEIYRQPDIREVVEMYIRPLPGVPSTAKAAEASAKPKGRKRLGLWIFLTCVAVVVVLAVGARVLDGMSAREKHDPFEWYYDEYEMDDVPTEITIPTFPTGQGAELTVTRERGDPLTAQEIYRQVNPSVVTVLAELGSEEMASVGTGVIFTEDGYIVTNYHVVEGGSECRIVLDSGRSYPALYVAGDEKNDLAVLKADAEGLPAAEFGDSDLLTVGDKVYAIGNPLGVELRGTLTDGIVSAINRDVWVDGRTMTLIQTNAALNSGNSGGPLINEYGQAVGINVIKMSSAYSSVEGLGFAIPSASMGRLVNDLLEYGEVQPEPVLGVMVNQIGEQLEEDLWGLEVVDVTAGAPAEKAGIRTGDFIIAANGEALYSSRDLLRVRRQYYVGDQLPLTLWRDGEIVEVMLLLEQAADDR